MEDKAIEEQIKEYLDKLKAEYNAVPPRDVGLRSWESENCMKKEKIAYQIQAIEELIVYLGIGG